MRIRVFHREELQHAHPKRIDVRGHRRGRVLVLVELRGLPTDGGCTREDSHGWSAHDVGKSLGESEIGERDDSLGMEGEGTSGGKTRERTVG